MNPDQKSACSFDGGQKLDPVEFVVGHRERLIALSLFAGLPYPQLEAFFHQCEFRRLTYKDVILSPLQVNHYLFILLDGELTIHIESLESDKGFKVMPGELVGEVSIIDGQAPTAHVVASAEESHVLCIHETLLWNEFIQIPGAARNIISQLASRMRARNLAIQKSVEQTLRLEYLEKELKIAQELQLSMLPDPPFFQNVPQVEVDAFIKPAKEVGGDFYDVFALNANQICIAIGDVAGKGVPAALFMVRSLTVLRTEMFRSEDLLKTIHSINETLCCDNSTFMFVTLMIAVIDTADGRLDYVNGGHNRPVFGNALNGFTFIDPPKGILLGINPKANYQLTSIQMKPGDMMIVYTDGITEAMNAVKDEFGESRLLEKINTLNRLSVNGVMTEVLSAVSTFTAGEEQSDDLTLLALTYHGNS